MASFSRVILSGSTDGKPIKIAATGTPGTTIHTCGASPGLDHVYAVVSNTDTADRTITVEFGGTTDPDHLVAKAITIPAKAHDFPLLVGQALGNSLVIKAFADSANKLLVTGYVNRYA